MRICLVMEYHPDDHAGGSEVQVFAVARALAAAGHEVSYVCQRLDRGKPREETLDGVRVVRSVPWLRTWRFLVAPWVRAAVRAVHPDVVYQRYASPLTGMAARAAHGAGVPFVWGCALDASLEPGYLLRERGSGRGLLGRLKRALLRVDGAMSQRLFERGLNDATAIVVQSEGQRDQLRLRWGRQAVVIPNGVALGEASLERPDPPVVLWLSRLNVRKRPLEFVRLARALAPEFPTARFVMVGGRAEDAFSSDVQAEAATVPGIESVGAIPFEDTWEWFRRAKVFVLTSEGEGFPNVFLQAWSCSTPVVSLSVDPDGVLAREGIGRVSGSPERMAEDVAELLRDEEERLLYARKGRDYAERHFEIGAVAAEYTRLFEKVIGGGTGS